jgi:hypothetical protein
MKNLHLRLLGLFLLFLIPKTSLSQDLKLINEQMFKQLDTVKNIHSKKIINRHYPNGSVKEIGVSIIKMVGRKKIFGLVGYHLHYYENGNIKDSSFFDINTNFSGIGKGYYEDGTLKFLAIGRDVSIEDGLRYSKFRTGLCDSYNLYYYPNGILGSEFGVNLKKDSNHLGDIVICAISYNKDGTIKSFEQKSKKE